ncbi:MAG: biotin/lipoyl-binding protein [Acetatifactor sp.]
MNEKGVNKREWVKTAAIIFLSVMLVLTFFSNTIMNYSLPEVSTKYVESGTITAKIRGTGTVESGDPYEIIAKESRKVLSVAVREGDKVQKGDVLFYLEDTDSEELKAAKAALEEAKKGLEASQSDYENTLLNADITSSEIDQANRDVSPEVYRAQITNIQKEITAAKETMKPLKEKEAQLTQTISDFAKQIEYEQSKNGASGTAYNTAKEKLDNAKTRLELATDAMTDANAAVRSAEEVLNDSMQTPTEEQVEGLQTAWNTAEAEAEQAENAAAAAPGDTGLAATAADKRQAANDAKAEYEAKKEIRDTAVLALTNAQAAKTRAEQELSSAQTAKNTAESEFAEAQKAYGDQAAVIENLTKAKNEYDLELYGVQKKLKTAEEEVAAKQEKLQELMSVIGNVTNLEAKLDAIEEAEKKVAECSAEVDKELAKAKGATITADISGTVSSINVVAGKTFQYQETLAVLQPEGQGCTMSFSVTNEQAKRLSVGDRAELVNSWRYDDLDVVLTSIKPDKANPAQNKLLTFSITGDIVAGQSLSVSVGQRSANYDYIVPNSALKEDSNGKFILIVESKSSPLGNRYIATRVDVEVVASDDTQSAIRGGIMGYEYVITTATKPVEAGQQVRLSDN